MKIEYLSSSRLPSLAANTVQVIRMCQAWGRLGHDVTLHLRGAGDARLAYQHYGVDPVFALSLHDENSTWTARIRASVPWIRFGPVPAVARGASIASDWGADLPDLIYARHVWWLLGASLRHPGVPFALELHAPPANRQVTSAIGWLLRRRSCRGLVVISKALGEEVRRSYPSARIIVAADASDDSLQPQEGPISVERAHLRKFTAGYVGHLYPGKGGELIVRLARRCPEIRFEVVGGTAADIGRLAGLGAPPNLVFVGHRPPSELPEHYRRFDALLAPYEQRVAVSGGAGDVGRWMSPLKVFEYMSWGKPILASDLPVLREVLESDRTALLLPPGDVEAWGAALEGLSGDPDRRARLGREARERFLSSHTWSQRAGTLLTRLGCG